MVKKVREALTEKLCSKCSLLKPALDFYVDLDYTSGLSSQCRKCVRQSFNEWSARNPGVKKARTKASIAKAKEDVLNFYGRRCACCGETNLMFLTVDHVNNDGGGRHRGNASNIYFHVRREGYPATYQILCFNCNLGKARNKGTCPHLVEKYAQ